jgi:hypothetical protein
MVLNLSLAHPFYQLLAFNLFLLCESYLRGVLSFDNLDIASLRSLFLLLLQFEGLDLRRITELIVDEFAAGMHIVSLMFGVLIFEADGDTVVIFKIRMWIGTFI